MPGVLASASRPSSVRSLLHWTRLFIAAVLVIAADSPSMAATEITIGETANVDGDGVPGPDVTGNIAAGDFPGNSFITSAGVASLLGSTDLSLAATNSITVGTAFSWNSAFGLTLNAGNAFIVNAGVANAGTGKIAFISAAGSGSTAAGVSTAGTLSLTTAGTLALDGDLSGSSITISNDGGLTRTSGTVSGASLTLTGAGSVGTSGSPLATDIGTLVLNKSGGNTYLSEEDTVALQGTTGSGALSLVASSATVSGSLSAGSLVISGTTTIDGGSITTAGPQTYNNAVALGADTTLSSSGDAISLTTVAGHNHALTIDSASASSLGATTGLSSLTKSGAGFLALTGANDYGGGTTIDAGTLAIMPGSSLATGGDVTINGSGVFQVGNDQQIRGLFSTSASSSVDLQPGKTLTVNLPDPDSDSAHSSSSFGGSLNGAGAFVKAGPGTLTLTHGSAGFTGPKTLSSGALRVTDSQALGNGAFEAAGGTIEFANNSSSTFTGTATTVTGNATFKADRTTNSSFSSVTHTLGTLAIGGQTLTVARGSHLTGASNTGALVFGATTLAGGTTFNVGPNALLTLGAVGDGGGPFGFTKSGGGTLAFAAASSFTGSATVAAGTVSLAHAGAADSAPWTFDNDAVLETAVAGSDATHGVINTGSNLTFGGTAQLKAQKSYSITGGAQSFTHGAALVARDPDAVAGGTQSFTSEAVPDGFTFEGGQALADFLVAQNDTDVGLYLKSTARLTINSDGSVSGGQQTFAGTSSLQANTGNAVTGSSTQTFSDDAHLRASQAHAVAGGTQSFTDNSFLWATAQDAVSGGQASFHSSINGASRLVAAAPNAVTGVTVRLYGDSFIDIRHDDALDSTTSIYFSGAEGGTGGKLLLNGHDTTVGSIRSGSGSNAGLVANDSEGAATLTVDFDGAENQKTFNGTIRDHSGEVVPKMIDGSSLALVKQGTGTLVLTGGNSYTGGTTIRQGTLAVSSDGGSITHPAADLVVGDTACDAGSLSIAGGGSVDNKFGWIGKAAGSSGFAGIMDAASQWINEQDLFVGYEGSGQLKISGGALVSSKAGTVGFGEESMGSVFIDGDQSKWSVATGLSIGDTGSGVVLLSNGGTLSVNSGTGTVTLGSSGGAGFLVIGSDLNDVAPKPGGLVNAATITTGPGSGGLFLATAGTGLADAYYLTRDGTAAGTAVTIAGWTHVISAAGVNILTGTNTYSGGTDILGGALVAQNDAALGNSPVHLTNAATLVLDTPNPKIAGLYDDSTEESFSGGTSTGALKLTPTVTSLTINVSSPFHDEFSGPILGYNGGVDGVSAARLIKLGSGMLSLAGANSYSGGTEIGSSVDGSNISGGILVAKNDAAFGTGDITVRAGVLGIARDISLANNVVLMGGSGSGNRAFIAGFGTVAPASHALVVGDRAGLSPGAKLDSNRSHDDSSNSAPVGTLFVGKVTDPTSVTFGAGGVYDWGVQNLGTEDGLGSDQIAITGDLTFTSTSELKFTFRLYSFDASGAAGTPTGFDPGSARTWTILTTRTNGGIAGFSASTIAIDATGFLSFPSTAFSLSTSPSGKDLLLSFNPAAVPEPSTWALLLTGLAVIGLVTLRRRDRR